MVTVTDLYRDLAIAAQDVNTAKSQRDIRAAKIISKYENPSSVERTLSAIRSILSTGSINKKNLIRFKVETKELVFPDALIGNTQSEAQAVSIINNCIKELRKRLILERKEDERDSEEYRQIFAEIKKAEKKIAQSDILVDATERISRINDSLAILSGIPGSVREKKIEAILQSLQDDIEAKVIILRDKFKETKSQLRDVVFSQLQEMGIDEDNPVESLGISLDILRAAAKMYAAGEHADEEKFAETNMLIKRISGFLEGVKAAQVDGVSQEDLIESLSIISEEISGIDVPKMKAIIQDHSKKQYAVGLERCKAEIAELRDYIEQTIDDKELKVIGARGISEYHTAAEELLSRLNECEREVGQTENEDGLVDVFVMMKELRSIREGKDKLESDTKELVGNAKIQKRKKFVQDSTSLLTEVLDEFGVLDGSQERLKLIGEDSGHEFSFEANTDLQEILRLSEEKIDAEEASLEERERFSDAKTRAVYKIVRSRLLSLNDKLQDEGVRREEEYGIFTSLLSQLNINMPEIDKPELPEDIRSKIQTATNLPKANSLLSAMKGQAALMRASYAESDSLYSRYKATLPEVKLALLKKINGLKYQDLRQAREIPDEYSDYKSRVADLEKELRTVDLGNTRDSLSTLYEMSQRLSQLQEEKEEVVSAIILQRDSALKQKKKEIVDEIQPSIDELKKLLELEFPEEFREDKRKLEKLAEGLMGELASIKKDLDRLSARYDFDESLSSIRDKIAPLKSQVEDFAIKYKVANQYSHEYVGFSREMQEYSSSGVTDEIESLPKFSLTEESITRLAGFVKEKTSLLDLSSKLREVQAERTKLKEHNRLDEIWGERVASDVRYSSTEGLTKYPSIFIPTLENADSVMAEMSDWYLSKKRGGLDVDVDSIERTIFLMSCINADVYKTIELNYGAKDPKDFTAYKLDFHKQCTTFERLHAEIENRRAVMRDLKVAVTELDGKIKELELEESALAQEKSALDKEEAELLEKEAVLIEEESTLKAKGEISEEEADALREKKYELEMERSYLESRRESIEEKANKIPIIKKILEAQKNVLSNNISRFENVDLDMSVSDFVEINNQLSLSAEVARRTAERFSDYSNLRSYTVEDLESLKSVSAELLEPRKLEQQVKSLISRLSLHQNDYADDDFETGIYYRGQEALKDLLREIQIYDTNLNSYDYISRLENLERLVKQFEDHNVDMVTAPDLIKPSHREHSLSYLVSDYAASSLENKKRETSDGEDYKLSLRESGNKAMELLYLQYKSPALHQYASKWCKGVEITKRHVDKYNDDIQECLSTIAKLSRELDRDESIKAEILDQEAIEIKARMQQCLQNYEKISASGRNKENDHALLLLQERVLEDYEQFKERLKEKAKEKINHSIDMLQGNSLNAIEQGRDTLLLAHQALNIIGLEHITAEIFELRSEEMSNSNPKAKYLREGARAFARDQDVDKRLEAISRRVSRDLINFQEKAQEVIRVLESIKSIDKLEGLESAVIEDCIYEIRSYRDRRDIRLQEAIVRSGHDVKTYEELLESFESEISRRKEQFKESIKSEAIEVKKLIVEFEGTETSEDKQRLLDVLKVKLKNLENLSYSEPPGAEETAIYYAELSIVNGNVREQYNSYDETIKSLKSQVLEALDKERKQEIDELVSHNVAEFKAKMQGDREITIDHLKSLILDAGHEILLGVEDYNEEEGYQGYYVEAFLKELAKDDGISFPENIDSIPSLNKALKGLVDEHNTKRKVFELFAQFDSHVDSIPEINVDQLQESVDASREHLQKAKEIVAEIEKFPGYEDFYREKHDEDFVDVYREYEKSVNQSIAAANDTLLMMKIHDALTRLDFDMQELMEGVALEVDIDKILQEKQEAYIESVNKIIQCYEQVSSPEVREKIAKVTSIVPIDEKCEGLLTMLSEADVDGSCDAINDYILKVKKKMLLQKFAEDLGVKVEGKTGTALAAIVSAGDARLRENIFESYGEYMGLANDPILKYVLSIIRNPDISSKLAHIKSIYNDLLEQGNYADIRDELSSFAHIKDTLSMLELAAKDYQLRGDEYDEHSQYSGIDRDEYIEQKVCERIIGFRLLSKLSSLPSEEVDEFLAENEFYINSAATDYIDGILSTINRHKDYLDQLEFPKDAVAIEKITKQIENEKENLARFGKLLELIPDNGNRIAHKAEEAKVALYDIERILGNMKIPVSKIREINKVYSEGPYEKAYREMCMFLRNYGLSREQYASIPRIFSSLDESFIDPEGAKDSIYKLSPLAEFAKSVAFEASALREQGGGYYEDSRTWYEIEPEVVKPSGLVMVEHSRSLLKYNADHDEKRRPFLISLLRDKVTGIVKRESSSGTEQIFIDEPEFAQYLRTYSEQTAADDDYFNQGYLINSYAGAFPQIQELLERLIEEHIDVGEEYNVGEMPIPSWIISRLQDIRSSLVDEIRDAYFLCVMGRKFGELSTDILYEQIIEPGEKEYRGLPDYDDFDEMYRTFDARFAYSDAELQVVLDVDEFIANKEEVEAREREIYSEVSKRAGELKIRARVSSMGPREARVAGDLEETLKVELDYRRYYEISSPEQDEKIRELMLQDEDARRELGAISAKIDRVRKEVNDYQAWTDSAVQELGDINTPPARLKGGILVREAGPAQRRHILGLCESDCKEFERRIEEVGDVPLEDPRKAELLEALSKLKELYRRMGYREEDITKKISEYRLQEDDVDKIFSRINELNTQKIEISRTIDRLRTTGAELEVEKLKAVDDAKSIYDLLSVAPIDMEKFNDMLSALPLHENLEDESSLYDYENAIYQQKFNETLVSLGIIDALHIKITNKDDLILALSERFPEFKAQSLLLDDESASVSSILEASVSSFAPDDVVSHKTVGGSDVSWIYELLIGMNAFRDMKYLIDDLYDGDSLSISADDVLAKLLQAKGADGVSAHDPRIIALRQLVKSAIDDDRENFNKYKNVYEVCFVLDEEEVAAHDKEVEEIGEDYSRLYDDMNRLFGRCTADFMKMKGMEGISNQCMRYKQMIDEMPDSYTKELLKARIRALEIRMDDGFEIPDLEARKNNLLELRSEWLRKLNACSSLQRRKEESATLAAEKRRELNAEEIDRLKSSLSNLRSRIREQGGKLGEREQELLDAKRRLAAANMELLAARADDKVSKEKYEIAKTLRKQVRDYNVEEEELSDASASVYQHIMSECEEVQRDYIDIFSDNLPGVDVDSSESLRYVSGSATRIVYYDRRDLLANLRAIAKSDEVDHLEDIIEEFEEFRELVVEDPPNAPIAYDNVHNKALLMILQNSNAVKSMGNIKPGTLGEAANIVIQHIRDKIKNIRSLQQEETSRKEAMLEQIRKYNNERVKKLSLELVDIVERLHDSADAESLDKDYAIAKKTLDKISAFDTGGVAIESILADIRGANILKERVQHDRITSIPGLELAVLEIYNLARSQYDMADKLSREVIGLFSQISTADTVRIANHIPHSIADIFRSPH